MKKLIVAAGLASFMLAAAGEAESNKTFKGPRKVSAAEFAARRQAMIARQGGEVLKPGSYQGWVAVVNESGLADAECAAAAEICAKATRCNIRVAKDAADAKAVLTVVNDPKAPRILLAPEDRWGRVNLANLMDDLPAQSAKDKFFPVRARRLIAKALAQVIGSGTSDYPGNIMSAAKVRELDSLQDALPADVIQRCTKHLADIGVTRRETSSYFRAAKEGWAPSPTNDVQRKIWAQVHSVPSKPITIKP